MSEFSSRTNPSMWRSNRLQHYLSACACLAVAALFAVAPASGQTFSYAEDFNSVADGGTPLGWVVRTSANEPIPLVAANPRVLAADPITWATAVDYSVAWSGGKRFTLIHPAWAPRAGMIWAAGATFDGSGATFGGAYPMQLQTNSLRAEFDLAYRTGDTAAVYHGCTFVIQPVMDAQHVRTVGRAYGRLGFDMNGFAIEFDSFTNTGFGGNGRGDPAGNNHVGVDLYRLWDVNNTNDLGDGIVGNNIAGGITVPSLKTSVEQGVTDLPVFKSVGDNNQPLHVTVFYNDPAEGGLGVVRVYVKVDPATGSMAYADTENGGLGRLVVEACVGSFPTQNAVFGFTAATSGSRHLSQVDNVHVETNAVPGDPACTVTYPDLTAVYKEGVPVLSPGTTVNLDATPLQADATGLSSPGWEVSSYLFPNKDNITGATGALAVLKASIAFQAANGLPPLGHAMGEPDINYWTGGADADGNIGDNRLPPGLLPWAHWFGILAKGFIYFPQAGDFSLCVLSDNGYELTIGGQIINTDPDVGVVTTGLNGGSFVNLHVTQAGVYPIQVLFQERWGSAYIEFYRRTDMPMMPYLLVGNSTGGLPDQPVIYGLRDGASAPDAISSYTPIDGTTLVNLSSTQKIDGGPDGNAAFKVKFVRGPLTYVYSPAIPVPNIFFFTHDLLAVSALRWLDVLNDYRGAPSTSPIINFRSNNDSNANLAQRGATLFPAGLESNPGSFGMRAEGYATFASAGVYYLVVTTTETGYLRIGNQTVLKIWDYNRNQGATTFALNVDQAGTYPIRLEAFNGNTAGGTGDFQLLEYNANGLVPVNGPGSSIVVHEAAKTAGGSPLAFNWMSSTQRLGLVIPSDRRVADHGAGKTLGWNAKMARTSLWWPAYASHGTTLIEDNTYFKYDGTVNPPGGAPVSDINGTDICPGPLDYADFTVALSGSGRFKNRANERDLTNFGAAFDRDGKGGYALSATGYIDFPTAGDYAINLHTSHGGQMWVGGVVVSWRPYLTVSTGNDGGVNGTGKLDNDSQHAIIHVDTAGIYDIRADFNYWQYRNFFSSTTLYDNYATFEVYQVLPDRTQVLVNDSASTVKVYYELNDGVTPASTVYHNPTQVPASARVAGRGNQPGFNLQVAHSTNGVANAVNGVNFGNWYGGPGADELGTLTQAHALLESLFAVPPVPALDQFGTAGFQGVVQRLAYWPGGPAPWDTAWPGGTQAAYFAARVTGYLDIKKGGHNFFFMARHGVNFTLGGQSWRTGSYKGNDWGDFAYFYIPEDGLYPYTLEFNEFDGNAALSLFEYKRLGQNSANVANYEVVNDSGSATKAYVSLLPACSVPIADMDGDHDVDLDDFGGFQACYTGAVAPPGGLQAACTCADFNVPADGIVDNTDLTAFLNCFTGPTIQWVASVGCPQ